MSRPKILVIAGPTASGKSALAVRLAKENQAVVLSADSRQFYHEISVGTARITEAEMQGVTHFFVGQFSVYDPISAGRFENLALQVIQAQHQLGKQVVVCGGSGLFLDALISGMDDLPGPDSEIRHQLEIQYKEQGLEPLLLQLLKFDPAYYQQVDRQNPRRVIRALEVCHLSGKPYSSLRAKKDIERPFEAHWIAPDWPRELLYQRINQRVDNMVENGLEQEARTWAHAFHLEAFHTIGYREWLPYFQGQAGLQEVVDKIKQNTRRLAKRQLTYWRRNPHINWIDYQKLSEFNFSF